MDLDPVLVSRIQFAFVVTFHIIFPAFTIGLAAWLAAIETLSLATGKAIYRRVFDFWLKVFALSFGMGVVSGIVMAFQFGTNWSVLAERTGSIQGPLLGYGAFTAFLLEASFFGVVMFGRARVPAWFYALSCWMVALGTTLSSFWIMANNSWMQVPVGYEIVEGRIIPSDWMAIIWGEVFRVRWRHMLLGAYLTTAMCVAATGAWYLLRRLHLSEARLMLHWGLVPAWSSFPWCSSTRSGSTGYSAARSIRLKPVAHRPPDPRGREAHARWVSGVEGRAGAQRRGIS